jgi:hypothetical protein
MIPQELDLVPGLDIAANLFLGNEITNKGVLAGAAMRAKRRICWRARACRLMQAFRFPACGWASASSSPSPKPCRPRHAS